MEPDRYGGCGLRSEGSGEQLEHFKQRSDMIRHILERSLCLQIELKGLDRAQSQGVLAI